MKKRSYFNDIFKVAISFMIYFRNSQNIFTNKLDSAIDTFMLDSFGELGIANRYN